MAEDEIEIDPVAEAKRIVNRYLSELGWTGEFKRAVVRQLIPAIEKDAKMKQADEIALVADENFGAEVDKWRQEKSKTSKAVLSEILQLLGKRSDLSFFGKRIVNRLKEEAK